MARSRLPRSARSFHGMTARTIAEVVATGFALGATPVALTGLAALAWMKRLQARL